jgi:hypothetical protein
MHAEMQDSPVDAQAGSEPFPNPSDAECSEHVVAARPALILKIHGVSHVAQIRDRLLVLTPSM